MSPKAIAEIILEFLSGLRFFRKWKRAHDLKKRREKEFKVNDSIKEFQEAETEKGKFDAQGRIIDDSN